jgi:hypothetical protein
MVATSWMLVSSRINIGRKSGSETLSYGLVANYLFGRPFKMAAQVPPAVVQPPIVVGVPNPPFHEMDQVLLLCGVTDQAARVRLINFEGLETIAEFGNANDAEIMDMAKRNESRTPAVQRVHLGMSRIKKLKAVAFWACKQQREGVGIDINNLNAAVINDTIKEMTLAPASAKKDEKLFKPDKFEPKRYKQWSRSVANYLDPMMGQSGFP